MKFSLNAALLQNVYFLHDVFNQKFELLCSSSFLLKKKPCCSLWIEYFASLQTARVG